MSTQTEPRLALANRARWEFGMPIGPGAESGERGRPARGPAARSMVPLSVAGLALAALIGLVAALLGARRSQPAPAQTAPAQMATARPATAQTGTAQTGTERDREAARDDGPARPAWYAVAALLIAVLFAGLAIFGYNRLSHWYRPVMLMATTTSPGSASINGSVQWSMTGFAGQLTVAGPDTGSAEIMLPVPAADCPRVTARLDVPCGPGGITLPSPAIFGWSPAQELSVSSQTTAGLDITPSTGAHGAPSVTISPASGQPAVCLFPLNPATLTITVGGRSFTQPFQGFTPCDGIAATVGTPGTLPPSFQLNTIDGLTLTAMAPAATLQGFTGQIMLKPGGTSVQGSPGVVALRAAGADRLTATLGVMTGSQALKVTSPAAASVMTGDGELVPSEWARETVVFGPLLGGFVTALVVAPLGVALGVLTDTLKRWPGPRRPARRREAGP